VFARSLAVNELDDPSERISGAAVCGRSKEKNESDASNIGWSQEISFGVDVDEGKERRTRILPSSGEVVKETSNSASWSKLSSFAAFWNKCLALASLKSENDPSSHSGRSMESNDMESSDVGDTCGRQSVESVNLEPAEEFENRLESDSSTIRPSRARVFSLSVHKGFPLESELVGEGLRSNAKSNDSFLIWEELANDGGKVGEVGVGRDRS